MIQLNKKIITTISGITLLTLCFMSLNAQNRKRKQEDYYQIKVYHLKNQDQINKTEEYLKNAFLPALHRNKINKVGVFK